jgi:hypothetical protein
MKEHKNIGGNLRMGLTQNKNIGSLEGILEKNIDLKEEKNLGISEVKNETSEITEELSVKRSYSMKKTTVKMLQELKVFGYEETSISYNEIIDEAIKLLYYMKKGK